MNNSDANRPVGIEITAPQAVPFERLKPLYSPPAPIGDALYLATANRLYLIAASVDPKRVRARYRGRHVTPATRPEAP